MAKLHIVIHMRFGLNTLIQFKNILMPTPNKKVHLILHLFPLLFNSNSVFINTFNHQYFPYQLMKHQINFSNRASAYHPSNIIKLLIWSWSTMLDFKGNSDISFHQPDFLMKRFHLLEVFFIICHYFKLVLDVYHIIDFPLFL